MGGAREGRPRQSRILGGLRRLNRGENAHAGAGVLLIIEVADASLDYERGLKMRISAEAGIPEYWLIDLNLDSIFSHSDPADGSYRSARQIGCAKRSPRSCFRTACSAWILFFHR